MKPKVYCASSHRRAGMWLHLIPSISYFNDVEVCSTWFKSGTIEQDETDPAACTIGWRKNLHELMAADYLLVFAEASDRPEGTFVEIGMAVGMGIPVVLVGRYPWASWYHLPRITRIPTFQEAIRHIVDLHNTPKQQKESSDDSESA